MRAFGASWSERISLWLPVAMLPFVLTDFWIRFTARPGLSVWLDFIASVIFLNGVHAIFTYVLLLRHPRGVEWVRFKNRSERIPFWVKVLAVFTGFLILFSPVFNLAELPQQWRNEWMVVAGLVLGILPHHHGIAQSKGIFLSLIRGERKLMPKTEYLVRQLIGLILLFTIIPIAAVAVGVTHPVLNYGAVFLGLLMCFALVAVIKRDTAQSTDKRPLIFLIRFFYFPLVLFSPAAVLATKMNHGIEYLSIYRRMNRDQPGYFGFGVPLYLLLMFASIPVLIKIFGHRGLVQLIDGSVAIPEFSYWIGTIGLAIAFTHYFLDREIFSMSRRGSEILAGRYLRSGSVEAEK